MCYLRGTSNPITWTSSHSRDLSQAYAETDHEEESQVLLQQVAQSKHPRHRLASIQLGAAYVAQGKHELAAETYTTVLAERPHHAAALAGLAEAAYWRGTSAIPSVLKLLTPAIDRATRTWTKEIPEHTPIDEEGEEPNGFQRLQLLIQWATLSKMDGNAADFACVALPLVTAALGQWEQRQEFELQSVGEAALGQGVVADAGLQRDRSVAEPGIVQSGQITEGGGQGSSEKAQAAVWKPRAVQSVLGKMHWEVDLRGRISSLAARSLEEVDVVAGVGRRVVFWHLIELVRCLHELGNSAEVGKIIAAAVKPNGILRGLEKKDLQVAAVNNDSAIFSTMPGNSPILGPAPRERFVLGPLCATESSAGDEASVKAFPEDYYPPPWRNVEERDGEGTSLRGGRAWQPANRSLFSSRRRSRSRALMELSERNNDGDSLCALVRALSRTPGNDAMWNLLQRVATERGMETADGEFHGEKVLALVSRHREQVQGLLYRGNDAVIWNRSKQALKLYRQAHALRPEEPLPMLCLATLIIRMVTVMDTMVENSDLCVLQGLAWLHRYADVRIPQAAATNVTGSDATTTSPTPVPEAVLQQEILYNLGRVHHQAGLTDHAIEYYNRALRMEDERGDVLRKWHGGDGLTKETAHNLCALYKKSGATAMALRILRKYLSVG